MERRENISFEVEGHMATEYLSSAGRENLVAASVLRAARLKGVKVWSEEGSLRYAAPRGAMCEQDLCALRQHKAAIIEILQGDVGVGERPSPRERKYVLESAPLAFSQLAHWNLYDLNRRPSVCIIPLVMRISGRLNVGALKVSASQLVRRHGALRTKIAIVDGVPSQRILPSWECPLVVHAMDQFSGQECISNAAAAVVSVLPSHVDVCSDPLFGMHLLSFGGKEHVLVIFMEHIIADGWSMGVIWRDLFEMYGRAFAGTARPRPRQPLQLAEYAGSQRELHCDWLKVHEEYWRTHFADCARVRFPGDPRLRSGSQLGWDTARFSIPAMVIARVREWSRRHCTTVVIAVFTAYVAFVLRWCSASEMVILFQTDGRTVPESECSVGYFAFPLYLRMRMYRQDDFVSLKNRVIEEYVLASEHADSSWVESGTDCPEYVWNTRFNWLPDTRGRMEVSGELAGSVMGEIETAVHDSNLSNLARDTEPMMMIVTSSEIVEGELQFPRSRFCRETMERFVDGFVSFLDALLRCPTQHVEKIPLVR